MRISLSLRSTWRCPGAPSVSRRPEPRGAPEQRLALRIEDLPLSGKVDAVEDVGRRLHRQHPAIHDVDDLRHLTLHDAVLPAMLQHVRLQPKASMLHPIVQCPTNL